MILRPFLLVFSILIIASCSSTGQHDDSDPIVKVGDKTLYSSIIQQLVTEGTSKEDSAAIVNGYVENWVRDNLIIQEAEKNIPPDFNLNQLVNEYRSSLLMYHYENQLIKTQLDTIVTDLQKQDFYDEYGAQFVLSHKIVRAIIIKSNDSRNSFSTWSKNQQSKNPNQILESARSKKFKIELSGQSWIPLEDLDMYIPALDLKKCKSGYSQTFTLGNGNIFIKIEGMYNENEIPPLDYIEEKIEQVMLNKRKTELLKSIRENLYNKHIKDRNIKYY